MAMAPPVAGLAAAHLDCISGPTKGQVFNIKTPICIIGREKDCDICLHSDPLISRHHAVIEYVIDRFIVRDNGSANGTRMNGMKVVGPMALAQGAQIEFGNSLFVFRWVQQSTSSVTLNVNKKSQDSPTFQNIKLAILGILIAIAIYIVTMYFVNAKVKWDRMTPEERAYKQWISNPPQTDDNGIAKPVVDFFKYNLGDFNSFELIDKSPVQPAAGRQLLWKQTVRYRARNKVGGMEVSEETYWMNNKSVTNFTPSEIFGSPMSERIFMGPPSRDGGN